MLYLPLTFTLKYFFIKTTFVDPLFSVFVMQNLVFGFRKHQALRIHTGNFSEFLIVVSWITQLCDRWRVCCLFHWMELDFGIFDWNSVRRIGSIVNDWFPHQSINLRMVDQKPRSNASAVGGGRKRVKKLFYSWPFNCCQNAVKSHSTWPVLKINKRPENQTKTVTRIYWLCSSVS